MNVKTVNVVTVNVQLMEQKTHTDFIYLVLNIALAVLLHAFKGSIINDVADLGVKDFVLTINKKGVTMEGGVQKSSKIYVTSLKDDPLTMKGRAPSQYLSLLLIRVPLDSFVCIFWSFRSQIITLQCRRLGTKLTGKSLNLFYRSFEG